MSWKMTGKVKPLTRGVSGKQLLPSEKLVLLILSDYYNDEQGYAWVSRDRLAKESLCSVRNLYRVLESLETDHKIVSIEKRKQGETDLYRFNVRTITDILSQEKEENVRTGTDIPDVEKPENVRTITDVAMSAKQEVSRNEQYLAEKDGGKEESTSTSTPPNSSENPLESYRAVKRIYRRFCKGNLGNPGERQQESWSSLIGQYGEGLVFKAFEIWARELGAGGKKLTYPIGVFLKNSEEYLEAARDAGVSEDSDLTVVDDDDMPTAADIRRQRANQ